MSNAPFERKWPWLEPTWLELTSANVTFKCAIIILIILTCITIIIVVSIIFIFILTLRVGPHRVEPRRGPKISRSFFSPAQFSFVLTSLRGSSRFGCLNVWSQAVVCEWEESRGRGLWGFVREVQDTQICTFGLKPGKPSGQKKRRSKKKDEKHP